MLDCTDYWKINNATTGLVLTDAAFVTHKTGNARRVVWGNQDYGFPSIKAVHAVEALAAGAKEHMGYGVLTCMGGGYNTNYDRFYFTVPQWATILPQTTANDDAMTYNTPVWERYDNQMLGMPWPDGATLCDGTVSKLFASLANSYSAFVLYRQFGQACPPPRGGKVNIVRYDKGSDMTTIVWETMENAAQNAAGELEKDHVYRLLWGSFDAENITDTEALMARVTVDGYPPLVFCGAGGHHHPIGARRVMFLDDSIMLRGDSVHKVEGLIGAACRPIVNLGWEDMGKIK